MGDFDPRMDKWGEHEVSALGQQFKDAILNKGREKRMHKIAARNAAKKARKAKRKARWKASLFRAKMWWFIRMVLLVTASLFAMQTMGWISL